MGGCLLQCYVIWIYHELSTRRVVDQIVVKKKFSISFILIYEEKIASTPQECAKIRLHTHEYIVPSTSSDEKLEYKVDGCSISDWPLGLNFCHPKGEMSPHAPSRIILMNNFEF